MVVGFRKALTVVTLAACGPWVLPSFAQKPAESVKVVQITGLPGVKNKTGGVLTVDGGNLHFSHGATKADLAAASVQDVVTGAESQRLIHGTMASLGLLAAPYGSGRFMSLFRTKMDTITITYHDADGGVHGAIFTMAVGKAEEIKKQLLAQGAHTSVPEQAADTAPAAKEQKP
jgi:ABC-type glycerol-3-phosphate transport system substrate-binding protein